MIFVALEIGSKFVTFERGFGVTPDLAPRQVGGKLGGSHALSH